MIELYKELARNKKVTINDIISYALIRAIHAKSENTVEIAKFFIARAFIKTKQWKQFSRDYVRDLYYKKEVFGQKIDQELVTKLIELCEYVSQSYINRKYCYIFVRQDISVEYQMVQAAHAAMMGGFYNKQKPDNIYFQLIGLPNKEELEKAYAKHGGHLFIEPDIGNEPTAFCTNVLNVVQRRPLQSYGLLKC